jgi:DNA-directed RNA polymerase specialized sigma24 family protein
MCARASDPRPRGASRRESPDAGRPFGVAPVDDPGVTLEVVVREHFARVWNLAIALARREDAAERLTHQVFREARAALGQVHPATLGEWLRRRTVRLAASAAEPSFRRRPSARPSNGDDARALDLLRLEAKLAGLDPSLRVPLALVLAGRSYAEIAADLGVPVATVRVRVSVAREALLRR